MSRPEPSVPTVILGMDRAASFQIDSQGYPPGRQPAQTCNACKLAYDLESPFHKVAATWWTKCLGEAEPVGLAHVILTSSDSRAFRGSIRLPVPRDRILFPSRFGSGGS